MSYLVIARKWRPQVLAELLGQEHVAQTLTNAIRSDRVAHAFLFSGPRGVGKTSAARILAKALCCTATEGPNPEPCGTCAQCVQITEGGSTDVHEIDAASHTGVDDVREIIENVRYLPSGARFKIYVIDEVHMLSKSAFNALLKTLEEPPAHAKFILATTDPQKVPVTILSRCQRYDFRRIPLTKIAQRLSFILKEEGVAHDPSALSVIAREAEGSMRDAQSLLEQVLAFAGERKIDAPLLRDALGVVDARLVRDCFDGLLERQPAALLEQVAELYARGLDLKHFSGALIEHARHLLVARVVPAPEKLLELPGDEVKALVAQAKPHPPETFERLYEQLCRVAEDVARARYPRFSLEIGLASLAEAPPKANLPHLMEQLSRLEAGLAGVRAAEPPRGAPQPRPPGRQRSPSSARPRRGPEPGAEEPHLAAPSAAPRPHLDPPRAEGSAPGAEEPSLAAPSAGPRPHLNPPRAEGSAPATVDRRASGSRPLDARAGSEGAPAEPQPSRAADAGGRPDGPWGSGPRGPAAPGSPRADRAGAGAPPRPGEDEGRGAGAPHRSGEDAGRGSGPAAPARGGGPQQAEAPPPAEPPPWLDAEAPPAWLDDEPGPPPGPSFEGFVQRVMAMHRPGLAGSLRQAKPLSFTASRVLLAPGTHFDRGQLSDPDAQRDLEALLAELFGRPVRLELSQEAAPQDAPKSLQEQEDQALSAQHAAQKAQALAHPAVARLTAGLDARVKTVRVVEETKKT